MPHDVRVSRSPNKRRTTNIEEPAMPRFMGFVRMEEGIGQPPQALMDAMGVYITEQASAGHYLDGGGLKGTREAVKFRPEERSVGKRVCSHGRYEEWRYKKETQKV